MLQQYDFHYEGAFAIPTSWQVKTLPTSIPSFILDEHLKTGRRQKNGNLGSNGTLSNIVSKSRFCLKPRILGNSRYLDAISACANREHGREGGRLMSRLDT
jgi:hypothetical protein